MSNRDDAMHDHRHGPHDGRGVTATTVIDPVCGMKVDPYATRHQASHLGQAYYFAPRGAGRDSSRTRRST
jgi:Cu+-exporting ATPase